MSCNILYSKNDDLSSFGVQKNSRQSSGSLQSRDLLKLSLILFNIVGNNGVKGFKWLSVDRIICGERTDRKVNRH